MSYYKFDPAAADKQFTFKRTIHTHKRIHGLSPADQDIFDEALIEAYQRGIDEAERRHAAGSVRAAEKLLNDIYSGRFYPALRKSDQIMLMDAMIQLRENEIKALRDLRERMMEGWNEDGK